MKGLSRFQVGVCVLHVPLCVAMMALALPSGCLACRGAVGSAVLRRAAVVPFRSAANMKSAPQPRRFSGIRNTASVNGALPGLARNVWDQEKQVGRRSMRQSIVSMHRLLQAAILFMPGHCAVSLLVTASSSVRARVPKADQ